MSRIFLLIFILFFSFAASAFDDIYLIKNLPVNVSDETPALARQLAARTVNREAFLTLLSRLKIDEKISAKVSDEEINDMIRLQHISDEKMAGNNYSAVFDLQFAKDFVDHILAQKNTNTGFFTINKEDEENQVFLVAPIQVQGNQAVVWKGNEWRDVFVNELKNYKQFILLKENLENIALINGDNAFNLNYEEVKKLIENQNAAAIYLLFFDLDKLANQISANISILGKLQKKQLKINFSNIDKIAPENLKSQVAQRIIVHLSNLKFDETVSGIANFKIKISDLGDWLEVRNKIEKTNLVNQIEVKAISRQAILATVNYVGDADIINSFASFGIKLQYVNENNYILYAD